MEHQARTQLDERKAWILKAIVEEYVETAQPVGSHTVSRGRNLGVSSATVRNDMTILEREGYIVQPHTSAGRVPTDLGYRYFVDHFIRSASLPAPERRAVSEFFTSAHRALEDLLHETSQFLARVTHHAALVSAPQADAARVRAVQLVTLAQGTALVLVVLSNGAVERQVVRLGADADDGCIEAAGAVLARELEGVLWGALPDPHPTDDSAVDTLVRDAHAALLELASGGGNEPVYVGGASHLASEQEFATAETAGRLLELLEHQVVVVALVRELLDQGLAVRIGAENQLDELRDCSIVLAPYQLDGRPSGFVGVLGPTRMDYRHALSAVSAVAAQLGRHLS